MDLQAQQLADALLGGRSTANQVGMAANEGYDPYRCPPNFEMAKAHGLAKRVYQPMGKRVSIIHKNVCPCCGLPKTGDLLPLKCKLSELYHLGSGYALYFKLLFYSIALLGIVFLISGFFNLVSSIEAGDCPPVEATMVTNGTTTVNNQCVNDFVLSLSIANKKDNPALLTAQMVLNLVVVLVMFVSFHYMRYNFRQMHIDADDTTVTPADYTVKIEGVDPELTDEQIKEWLENLPNDEMYVKVAKINRTYDIVQYVELKKKKDNLELLRRQVDCAVKQQSLQNEADQTETELQQLKDRGLKPTRTVLVTMDKAEQAAYLIGEYKKVPLTTWKERAKVLMGGTFKNFYGKEVHIERAPEPTDILWENLNYGSWEKFKKRMVTRTVSTILILISFGLIVLINWGQGEALNAYGPKSHVVEALSGTGSILIVVINAALGIATRILTNREMHGSQTSFFTSVADKLSMAQFLNTAFTTLLAQIALHNAFKQDGSFELGLDAIPFYGKGGLVENMFYVFISNAFLTPILALLDPMYFLKLYQRKKVLKTDEETLKMTQLQAHALFEEPAMDLAVKNSLLVKTMLMTAFFAPAVPFALIFAIIGLVANYWADKYLLLRRNIFPIALQNQLCNEMLDRLEWMGFMFGAGNLLFILGLENADGISTYNVVPQAVVIITLILGFVFAMLPSEAINERLFPIIDEVTEHNTYNGIRAEFPTDYEIQNPITRQEGLHEQAELLKKKKELLPKIRKNIRRGVTKLLSENNFGALFASKKSKDSVNTTTSDASPVNDSEPASLSEDKPAEIAENQTLLSKAKPKFNLKGLMKAAENSSDATPVAANEPVEIIENKPAEVTETQPLLAKAKPKFNLKGLMKAAKNASTEPESGNNSSPNAGSPDQL